jgi:hypothetical protein
MNKYFQKRFQKYCVHLHVYLGNLLMCMEWLCEMQLRMTHSRYSFPRTSKSLDILAAAQKAWKNTLYLNNTKGRIYIPSILRFALYLRRRPYVESMKIVNVWNLFSKKWHYTENIGLVCKISNLINFSCFLTLVAV